MDERPIPDDPLLKRGEEIFGGPAEPVEEDE